MCVCVSFVSGCGRYYIRCLSEETSQATEVVERKFRVECNGEPERVIIQYHFIGWPDFGVPSTGEGVFNILEKIKEFKAKDAPIVVHCSAGIGRTGTFCTIDIGMQMLQQEGWYEHFCNTLPPPSSKNSIFHV